MILEELKDLIEKYKKYLDVFTTPNTARNYLYDLKLFLDYLDEKQIDDIKKVDSRLIYEYIVYMKTEKGNSSRSINRRINALKKFFIFLLRERIITHNPLNDIKHLKENPRQIQVLSEEKIEELKSKLEEPYKSIFIFLLNTGLRIGEFLSLIKSPIKISKNAVIVAGKGNRIRQIPLNQTAMDCILRIREAHQKEKLTYDKIWKEFKKYGIHPHMVRHTFATYLLKKGLDIGSVRDLLGHSNIRTTSVYIDLINPEKIKIPEL